MKHFRYNMQGASRGHPQTVMKELGITYQKSTPQSICDQWWFWNCENIPEGLPDFISELKVDPMEQIGNGLSQSDAEEIRDCVKHEKNIRLSSEDLELCRQWFGSVQDCNPEYLNKKDYSLAIKIHNYFGLRVSNSLRDGLIENLDGK